MVLNKPALLDSQDSRPGRASVVDWLREKYGFPGLVHRLDFGTSGLLLAAKTPDSAARLAKTLQAGQISRSYLAVVLGGGLTGKILPDEGAINTPIDAQTACTHFRVRERFINATFVEIDLETGRKHQIRKHFSQLGFPLLGDHLYGKRGAARLFDRPALHAYRLVFHDGADRKEFTAPIPADLDGLLSRLRTKRS